MLGGMKRRKTSMPTQDQIEGQTGAPGALHANLADVIDRWTVGKEDCATPIPNLDFFRREKLTEPRALPGGAQHRFRRPGARSSC